MQLEKPSSTRPSQSSSFPLQNSPTCVCPGGHCTLASGSASLMLASMIGVIRTKADGCLFEFVAGDGESQYGVQYCEGRVAMNSTLDVFAKIYPKAGGHV